MSAHGPKISSVIFNWVKPNLDSFFGLQKPKLWLMALLAGAAGAMASIAFRQAIGLIQWLWAGTREEIYLDHLASLPWWIVVAAPTTGGLIVGLILLAWGPSEQPGAVADVIEERAQSSSKLNIKRASISTLISLVTLGFGGSAGREGPVVYYAAAVAKSLTSFFDLPPLRPPYNARCRGLLPPYQPPSMPPLPACFSPMK